MTSGIIARAKRDRGVSLPMSAANIKAPIPTLERLSTYLRHLLDLEGTDIHTVSSRDIEKQTGISAAQFRKDLSYFGEFGKPGVGYNVTELHARITQILKIDRTQPVLLVGAGNLGAALVGYPGLGEHNFEIVGVFDNNVAKIGRHLWGLEIRDVADLVQANRELRAYIAIIAVPPRAASEVADLLVEAGVRVMLNFAPAHIKTPAYVYVRNMSFLQELAVLSYHLFTEDEATRSQEAEA